jgi:replicative DNA helicase
MERVESEELRALLAEKTNTDEFSLNPGQAVTDTVHQIKKRSLQKQIKEIQAEIRHAEAKGSGYSQQEVDELQQEILYLNGELNKLG